MDNFTYECHINKEEMLKDIEDLVCVDSWGEVEYGDGEKAVDYNICIDNSTNETEYCSAFYKLYKNSEGYWIHDCSEWYSYEIDFNDKDWEEKLKEAAKKAYNELWGV